VLTLAEYLNTIVNLPDDNPAVLRYSAMLDRLQERFAYRVIDITREIAMAWGVLPINGSA
jgi:hypothetical protein